MSIYSVSDEIKFSLKNKSFIYTNFDRTHILNTLHRKNSGVLFALLQGKKQITNYL